MKGSFDRSPSTKTFHQPDASNGNDWWEVIGVVMISVGKDRGEYLLNLYDSISQLISLQLPHLEIEFETNILSFS
ncbi:MAG: hypothetical protein WA775_02845 [Psychroserpens sp.]|uniref:hypothetical protein n=1 Tax=Psychroserpens sp. TaxID=2020870 RepID=UPI003CAA7923